MSFGFFRRKKKKDKDEKKESKPLKGVSSPQPAKPVESRPTPQPKSQVSPAGKPAKAAPAPEPKTVSAPEPKAEEKPTSSPSPESTRERPKVMRKKRSVTVKRKGKTATGSQRKRTADFFMKLVLCGDGAVGKTALRERFLGRGFSNSYLQTIGADFASTEKEVGVDGKDYSVQYQIWDLAGQTEFGSVRQSYYEGCFGSLMIFDLTRPSSFENLPSWIDELWSNSGRGKVPIVLLGNKADLKDQFPEHVQDNQIMNYVQELNQQLEGGGFSVQYLETSALTGKNVEEAFTTLGEQVVRWIQANK